MTTRPRIRSLKPEIWEDERIGKLSRDARLLFVGLITMADDEGRFRAMPSIVLGHVYPYDDLPVRKLAGWMDELELAGLIDLYSNVYVSYGAIVNWRKHQRISHPRESLIPSRASLNGSAE